ncbi:MAG: pantetheine-phosphate adenylyltransferase [Armatimonadetes bacterium]|nr:pantetheine-phosphate adenylyltransferase [Armatimonadota bacterium]
MSDSSEVIAYCPGSFDPITNGHLDIIERAAQLFDRVIIGVALVAEKTHLFSPEERLAMCREACAHLSNVTVQTFEGLLVEAVHRAGARVIVKGLRQSADLAHEAPMATMNRSLRPEIETLFLLASPTYAFISSSLIKWVCSMGGDISAQVPAGVAPKLTQRLAEAAP